MLLYPFRPAIVACLRCFFTSGPFSFWPACRSVVAFPPHFSGGGACPLRRGCNRFSSYEAYGPGSVIRITHAKNSVGSGFRRNDEVERRGRYFFRHPGEPDPFVTPANPIPSSPRRRPGSRGLPNFCALLLLGSGFRRNDEPAGTTRVWERRLPGRGLPLGG